MNLDKLRLGSNNNALKMLNKMGDNFPEEERIILSMKVIKINKRGSQQERVLLLTDKALYNIKSKSYKKAQRRIEINKIVSISVSKEEFAIHIPEEYDYRYKSNDRDVIVQTIAEVYQKKEGKKLTIQNKADIEAVVITKDIARLQTREQRLKRYRELVSSEPMNVEDQKAQVTGQLINSKEKVAPSDFEFLKVIGRGSFGKVMQVRKKDTGEIFAMKILKKKALIAKHQVEHTNAERKILQSLQHPFLMKLRFAFQTEAKLYFVLNYYRGGELFFHLKKKRRFSEEEAKFIVAEVAMALGHLHALGIIYRDLKPENILLEPTGNVCLTDFGLSKDLAEDELANTFCGTPEYLAPEIVMNLGHNKAVDWWSLGILLYELTVGIPPFYSQNVNEMYRKIQDAPLLFPPNLSVACKSIITQLLERDPKKRLGSGKNGFENIQKHPFWKTLSWDLLYKKQIKAPYKPNIKNKQEADTSQFDPIFLKEKAVDSLAQKPVLETGKEDGFGGFTFMPRGNLG